MFRYLWVLPTIAWIVAAWRAAPLGAPYVALCLGIAAVMPIAQHIIDALDRREAAWLNMEDGDK